MKHTDFLDILTPELSKANPNKVYQHLVWEVYYDEDKPRNWRPNVVIGDVGEYIPTDDEGELVFPKTTCQFNQMDMYADDDEISNQELATILFKYLEEFDRLATEPFIAFTVLFETFRVKSEDHLYKPEDIKFYFDKYLDLSGLKRKGFRVGVMESDEDDREVYNALIIFNV